MHDQIELIRRLVGRINSDILAGWEIGPQGKQRIAGKLVVLHAPEHLSGQRLDIRNDRVVRSNAGTKMAKAGAHRNGLDFYFEGAKVMHKVSSGI